MALLFVTLVKEHGLEYLFAATVLTGIIQFILGLLKVGRFLTFIPAAVMIGFVNALAILIFMAQLPQFVGANWLMYALVAATLAIIYLLPRLTKAVPSALVAIMIITVVTISMGWDVRTVKDLGQITQALPIFHLPSVPLNVETFMIILPYAVSLAFVGILESLLTASIIDEMTDTKSDKNREVRGQGIANFVTGFFGGMGGCAMIGQSVINVKSGGRGRLSTFVAGAFLLFLIIVLGDIVSNIPMAALVGVMIMVSIGTFDWQSVWHIRKMPLSDAVVMVVTVVIVVATHDLSKGVLAGVVLSALVFGWKSSRIHADAETVNDQKVYRIKGQLFFGTNDHFVDLFTPQQDQEHVVIDFTHAHVWDHSGVVGIAKVVNRYKSMGLHVEIVGLNQESQTLVNRIGLSGGGSQ
ncbi:SulP family inorganic anion transporter [Tumebacillus sp. DT12]|uniref:SulP family inorganic anion transporter n=1 Tax=Tumebacillus lacus TaxID=2995335 RepID=A0ABT3X652_9BACL|nr:SulP family inorganic anion transporter [Tumebacillus lacus]MCX7572372.1 SulP family inorganic anion transporter [Tumebacillus lacus]